MVEIHIEESPEQVGQYVADLVANQINSFVRTPEKQYFVLGLPTGSSPEGTYRELVRLYREGKVSFKNVVTFNMDEYVGLGPEDPQSYHAFMYHHLFGKIDIEPEHINILNGKAKDLDAECKAYEEKINQYGGIDLFLGGLGVEGHIAFNEAGSSIDSKTRKIALAPSTIEVNSRFFSSPEQVPRYALSIGVSTLLKAREIVIIVLGAAKQKALKEATEGPISSKCPASFLQTHGNCIIAADKQAVGPIKGRI